MAARENQGYLIAVIILVLLTLVLALAAFLGMSKASEMSDSNTQNKNELAYNKTLVDAYSRQVYILKALAGDLGYTIDETKTFDDDLKGYPSKFEGAQQTALLEISDDTKALLEAYEKDMAGVTTENGLKISWRQRNRDLTQLVAKKNSEFNIQFEDSQRTNLDAETKIAAMEKTVAALQTSMAKVQEELDLANKQSLEKQAELESSLDKAIAANNEVNKKFLKTQQEADEADNIAQNEIRKVNVENQGLKSTINKLTRKDFDRADGKIVSVATGLRTAYIDLGSSHGLTNNQLFSVYNKDVTNFKEGQHKASIEITEVRPYQSVARITFENPSDPILSGDHILTPTWDPGFKVPFAVTGRFDLDGDNYDDTQKLIQMINRNGGEVVAYHDDEGNIQGKIDSGVRFLVVGSAPKSGANSEKPEAARAIVVAMQQMQDEAKANTVEPIDLQKLLNQMGVRAQPKTLLYKKPSGGFTSRSPSDATEREDN